MRHLHRTPRPGCNSFNQQVRLPLAATGSDHLRSQLTVWWQWLVMIICAAFIVSDDWYLPVGITTRLERLQPPSTEVDEIHSKPLADTDAFEGEIGYDLSVTVCSQVTPLSVALTAGDNVACQQPEKPPRNRVTKHMGAKGFGLYHNGGWSRQTSVSTTPALIALRKGGERLTNVVTNARKCHR